MADLTSFELNGTSYDFNVPEDNALRVDLYYDEITYEQVRLHDTDCYITTIPKYDSNGEMIKLYVDGTDSNRTHYSPLDYANDHFTTVTTNASLDFNLGRGWECPIMIGNGVVLNNNPITDHPQDVLYLGIKADRSISEYVMNSITSADMLLNDGCEQVFNVFYKLVDNGSATNLSTLATYWTHQIPDPMPKQSIGIKSDGTIIIFTCDGRTKINRGLTAYEEQEELVNLGCVRAWEMDGGGSACTVICGSKLNRNIDDDGTSVRKIPFTLNIKKNKENPQVNNAYSKIGEEKQNIIEQVVPYINYLNSEINNAYMYRNLTRNLNITDAWYNGTLQSEVASGDFSNVRPGDYIIGESTGVKYYVADLDLYYYTGESGNIVSKHHLVMLAGENLTTAKMNDSLTTTGGYYNSKMKVTTLPAVITSHLTPDFGTKLITYSTNIPSAVTSRTRDTGEDAGTSGWTWTTSQCDLLNETAVYGQTVFGGGKDVCMQSQQLAIFRLWGIHKVFTINRRDVWLSDVANSEQFANISYVGNATKNNASNSYGVCPWFLIG